jgi:hypothetical protein
MPVETSLEIDLYTTLLDFLVTYGRTLGNMTVVLSATEAELTYLLLGLLKQHNRLKTNNSVRNNQLIKPPDSSEKGTQFITLLRLSVDLRGCVHASRCTAARTLEPHVRVLLEK